LASSDAETPAISLRGKFTADTAWTFSAFGVFAVGGAFICLFVAGRQGGEALGVFNQVYALYVVAAQLATLGIHDSAQKHVAQHADDPALVRAVSRGAVAAVLRTAIPVALVFGLGASFIGRLADSEPVGRGVLVVAPALVLFALNKTLLGVLNGQRRMRAYALGQIARSAIIALGVVGVGLSPLPDWALVGGFALAELMLCPALLVALRAELGRAPADEAASWRAKHLRFGARALPNSLLAESFIRIDILMLGLLTSDAEVGLYSLAALFVEGLYQIAIVVRTVANPLLVKLWAAGRRAELAAFCRRIGAVSLLGASAVGAAVYLAFPWLDLWLSAPLVAGAGELLPVLLAGLVVAAAFVPSDHLLLQAGRPGKQSLLMTANVALNVALNAVLIPRYGPLGAAFATAAAFVGSAIALNLAAARWLGMTRTVFASPPRAG
jgi:O-antigen/teichoic acid export membrane protein